MISSVMSHKWRGGGGGRYIEMIPTAVGGVKCHNISGETLERKANIKWLISTTKLLKT